MIITQLPAAPVNERETVEPARMVARVGLAVRCSQCRNRPAICYWKAGKPYCQECKDADPVQWIAPAPLSPERPRPPVSVADWLARFRAYGYDVRINSAGALALCVPESMSEQNYNQIAAYAETNEQELRALVSPPALSEQEQESARALRPYRPEHMHAVLTATALVIAFPDRAVRSFALSEPVTSIADVCNLANRHDVSHVWIMPGLPIAMIASDETWDVFSSWTHSSDETGARRSQDACFALWQAGESHPLFTRLWKRGPKSDPMCRQVKIGFPEYGDWLWDIETPVDILATISYLETVLGVIVEWSPGHIGTELVKHLNRTARRAQWIRESTVDLNALPFHRSARDLLWNAPLSAQDVGLFILQYDKRSAYLSSCPGVFVGAGDPEHKDSDIDTSLPGIYRIEVLAAPAPFDNQALPAIITTTWVTDDVLNYASEQGYSLNVCECWQWEEKHKTLESYARKLWESRNIFRTDSGRFPHERGRENAGATMKVIALVATGKFASRKTSQFIRPDWWAKVVGKTRVNILRNLFTFARSGHTPVLIYSDSIYFVSDTPDPRAAIPGILARETELGGYRHEGTWTITPELVEAFSTMKPGAIQKLLEHTPQREGNEHGG